MRTDTTFFTNEPEATLLDRFRSTLSYVRFFDILVGYFRATGFYRLYDSMEPIEKIRVLVGLSVDRPSFEVIEEARDENLSLDFDSHARTKERFSDNTITEMATSYDSYDVELGIRKFLEFLTTNTSDKTDLERGGNGKKMEFRVYPTEKLHAKVYISRFPESHFDFGRVITGSSNFSESGLVANREFNVELKDRVDVEFALSQLPPPKVVA